MNTDYAFTYPELPILEHREAILKALQENQALVVQGGTGSGKTTQLPKFLVQSGMFSRGMIGVTQPRRIAALSITDRLREETGIRELVGAKIRFHDDMPREAKIKVMTDGILLQEFRRDPLMRQYSCIILDEAHERSLNVDILLGIFRTLLLKRPDFRLVVTSATLDANRFAAFLGTEKNPVPVIEVEGRQYPVSLEYWDLSGKDANVLGDQNGKTDEDDNGNPARAYPPLEAAAVAIRELQARRPDNLLAFLPTEKEIHELHRELEKDLGKNFSILPLYGRLSPGDQKKVFTEGGMPKIILATNIAETSLTIPGIGYVVDMGLARISRYHPHTKIQGLPIERISKASAKQRTGRAGRVKAGVCVRLYSEADFNEREEFTEPEILRSNLANVVLQLLDLNLPVENFPFPDAPAPAALKGAFRQLHELGAVSEPNLNASLTPVGRELSQLPVDVTLGKILLTATHYKTLQPAIILAAGITVQDPRITPREEPERGVAVGLHRRFEDPRSDFMGILALWVWVHRNWGETFSQRKLRVLCEENYISFNRMREWIELTEQFCRLLKVTLDPAAISSEKFNSDSFHKSILSGFLPFLARKKPADIVYRLAGDKDAFLHPGSGLAKQKPEWIVATEVRQTSRVFIFRACEIKPHWIEELVPDSCKKTYVNVSWNGERGFVEALERVTYKGFAIRQDRRVNYESVNPDACAEVFWMEGVIRNQLLANSDANPDAKPPFIFIEKNQKALAALATLESKARMRSLVPSEITLSEWYRFRAPEVTSRVRLEKFLQTEQKHTLEFSEATWIEPLKMGDWNIWFNALKLSHNFGDFFPETLEVGDIRHPVTYRFDYGAALDGISVELDPESLSAVSFQGLVLGLPSWRKWVWEYFLERLGNKTSQEVLVRSEEVLFAWEKELRLVFEFSAAQKNQKAVVPKLNPANSLISTLILTLKNLGISISNQQGLLPSTWPSQTQIHLFIVSQNGRRFLIHMDPSMGPSEIFNAIRRVLFGESMQKLTWKEFAVETMQNFNSLPAPLLWNALHFGADPFSSPRFFLDKETARFYTNEGNRPLSLNPQLTKFIGDFVSLKLLRFEQIWNVPNSYSQVTDMLRKHICYEVFPSYYLTLVPNITESHLLLELQKDFELIRTGGSGKSGAQSKSGAPVKSLLELKKVVAKNSESNAIMAMGLYLGAALVSKECFFSWHNILSPTSTSSKLIFDEILKLPGVISQDLEMLKSPFYVAWLANSWRFFADDYIHPGSEALDHFEKIQKQSEQIRKSTKTLRDQFCQQISLLGLSVSSLPQELKRALAILDQPNTISQKCFAILELELYLHKVNEKWAGRIETENKEVGEVVARKEQIIKNLSNRYRKL